MNRRILVVDDDPGAREGLVGLLRAQAWEAEPAESGLAALARLAGAPCDVVIAGVRHAGLGGAALLATVASEHPELIRFARCEGSAGEIPIRVASCAHQVLADLTTPNAVVEQVRRAFALRDAIGSPAVRAIVGRLTVVPTLPSLYTAVMTELQRPHASTLRIGAIVADDPAMAAKLLQMVNSPFFGLRMRVSDPAHAVRLLGLDTVRGLVLSTHVFDSFRKPTRGLMDIEQLWHHAVSVGAIAGSLAAAEGLPADDVHDARTAGLLHDIGKLLLVASLPVVATRIRDRARVERRPVVELEREEIGSTHAELGAYLLGLWGLPLPIVEATARHHAPSPLDAGGLSALSLVIAANIIDGAASERFGETRSAETRLAEALVPFGLQDRASRWLAWADESVRAAA